MANQSRSVDSPCLKRTPLYEQHKWLFQWPPLLYSLFWVSENARGATRAHWFGFAGFYLVFVVAYLRVFRRRVQGKLWLGVLFVIGYGYFPFNHAAAGEFVFPVVMSVYLLRESPLPVALGRFAAICLASAGGVLLETRLCHAPPAIAANVIFYMVAIGLTNFAYSRLMLASEQLQRANQEIEHLAQVAERERIARDLHDLLGHTLTVITLKADVANRLFTIDPERAHREIAEVEATARKALAEVREAVTGYRTEGFAQETVQARRTLASAGVQLTTDVDLVALPEKEAGVLCLVLREAVTNVVRHAGATACRLVLRREGTCLRLTVEDNGSGPSGTEGNGLRGMRERLTAGGGSLLLEAMPGGGTRLTAELPWAAPEPGASLASELDGISAIHGLAFVTDNGLVQA